MNFILLLVGWRRVLVFFFFFLPPSVCFCFISFVGLPRVLFSYSFVYFCYFCYFFLLLLFVIISSPVFLSLFSWPDYKPGYYSGAIHLYTYSMIARANDNSFALQNLVLFWHACCFVSWSSISGSGYTELGPFTPSHYDWYGAGVISTTTYLK